MTASADVLVIGGGPGGAAAACRLAGQGLRVVLCERQAEPRPQVCGEFLSATAAAELADLGMEPSRLGARPLTRVRLFAGSAVVTTRLPFAGYGLSRHRLDPSLLATAGARGAEIRRGIGVRALDRVGGVWRAALGDGSRVESGAVVLATGKHDMRGHVRIWGAAADLIGFKMHVRLDREQAAVLDDAVELFPFDGGYAGLQLIETGAANLCFVVAAEHVRGGGRAWTRALGYLRQRVPALGERLDRAHPLDARPASVARLPYGYVCRPANAVDGLYRVGDQAAVIPSLAGEGIAIALRSARLAARAIAANHDAQRYVNAVRDEVVGPLRWARLVEVVLCRRPRLALVAVPGILPALARLTRLGVTGR